MPRIKILGLSSAQLTDYMFYPCSSALIRVPKRNSTKMNKDFSRIKEIIGLICESQPAIVAAYIFGSFAKRQNKPKSDIDVAILLDETIKNKFSIFEFSIVLEKKIERKADVVILNNAGEILKYEVRRRGVLIFERSSDDRKQFEVMGRKYYEDFLYLHRKYVNTVLYGEAQKT